jgi:hypothetical protein
LAQRLGVDETQAIHLALREMAGRMLPHFKTVQAPGTSTHTQERHRRAPAHGSLRLRAPSRQHGFLLDRW